MKKGAEEENEVDDNKTIDVQGWLGTRVKEDRIAYKDYDDKLVERLFSNLEESESGGFQRKEGSVLGATALVAGTTVGAGVLALPAATASTGVIPSSIILLGMWAYMVASGLLLAETNLNLVVREGRVNLGLLAVAERTLGRAGGRAAGAAYLFIHYCLLVAYLAQGGALLADLLLPGQQQSLPEYLGPVGFCAIFGGLLAFGSEALIESVNNVFVTIVITSFLGLLVLATPGIEISRLFVEDWSAAPGVVPVTFVALVFHNVVPVIVTQLEADRAKIRQAVLVGSALPLGMFLAWNAVVLGSTDTAAAAAVGGVPVDPLATLRAGSSGAIVGEAVSIFSLFAIITSFFGFVLGLLDFFTDVFEYKERDRAKEFPLYGLILLPPLGVACTNPSIFFEALDKAGTYGISVLFGIIPAAMAWVQRYNDNEPVATSPMVPGGKVSLTFMIAFASAVIVQQGLFGGGH
uniref:Tyrosine-specific transport protein n=1 Tax=Heterosigma akashiwo TaxID=2829 RepID=A0A6V1NZW3_HETAK